MYDNDNPNPNSLGVVISFTPFISATINLITSLSTNKQQKINMKNKIYLIIVTYISTNIHKKNEKGNKRTIY